MENNIEILVFGQLTDITGTGKISLPLASTSDELLGKLYDRYPALREKTFLVSLDQHIIKDSRPINEKSTIALLPPFSGG